MFLALLPLLPLLGGLGALYWLSFIGALVKRQQSRDLLPLFGFPFMYGLQRLGQQFFQSAAHNLDDNPLT